MNGVECWLSDPNSWGHISLGQKITVRGTGNFDLMQRVIDCRIIDKGPSTAVNTTAAAMAAGYQAGTDAFEKKYKDKTVVVEGDVAKKEASGENTIVWLKGAGGLNVGCIFDSMKPADKAAADKINVGDHVTLTGTCESTPATGQWLTMTKRVSK